MSARGTVTRAHGRAGARGARVLAVLTGIVLVIGADRCPPGDNGAEPTPNPPPAPRKVAVLVSASVAETARLANNTEFWTDTVLTYCMLRRNGFLPEDIHVLYGDGYDGFYAPAAASGATAGGSAALPDYYTPDGGYCGVAGETGPITDLPMATAPGVIECLEGLPGAWRCQPEAIFRCLAEGCADPAAVFAFPDYTGGPIAPLGPDDYLFVWWKGHGSLEPVTAAAAQAGQAGPQPSGFTLLVGAGQVGQDVLTGWIDRIPAGHRLYVFETCKSGCLAEALGADPRAILLTSCACGQDSWNWDTHDTWHGVFSFWIDGTLAGILPPGSTNPLAVDLASGQPVAQAFDGARKGTVDEVGPSAHQEPTKVDSAGEAGGTRLDNAVPCPTPVSR